MKRILVLTIIAFIQFSLTAQIKNLVYKDKNAAVETRIKDLVSKMNLEEKILQLNQYTAGHNTNVYNIVEAMKAIPSGIGSLIYTDANVKTLSKTGNYFLIMNNQKVKFTVTE